MASLIHFRLFGIALIFLLTLSSQGWSCAVCQGGQTREVQDAYIWITVLLSLFPLFAFGGFFLYWRKKQRNKKLEDLNSEDSETLNQQDDNSH